MSAPTDAALEARTIVIERLEVLRSGFTTKRHPYTLFKVHANDLSGDPIGGELRTFQRLVGTVEVSFDPRHDGDGNVESYTLRETGRVADLRARRREARDALTGNTERPSAGADEITDLRARMDALEQRFAAFAAIFDPERTA